MHLVERGGEDPAGAAVLGGVAEEDLGEITGEIECIEISGEMRDCAGVHCRLGG